MNPVKEAVKKWLREQFIQLVTVQRVTFGQRSVADPAREADLVVLTWSGVMICVYLIDEAMKPPRVRRILEHDTNAGIVALFILDAALLPRQGERVPPDRWFTVFQHISNDHLYSYRLETGGVSIRPARFLPVSRTEVEIQYGAKITEPHLRYYRSTVKHQAIKGYWLVADLETDATARATGFRRTNSTRPPRQEQKQEATKSAPQKPALTKLDSCYRLLGLPSGASREDVKAAFRKLAFEVHPDVSDLPKAEAEARFKALSEAYEYIKVTNSWT